MKGIHMNPKQSLTLLLATCGLAIASAPLLVGNGGIATAQEATSPFDTHTPLLLAQDAEPAPSGEAPLSIEEATERLSSVPVFSIVSEDNSPVLANIEQEGDSGETVQLVSFWLDHTAAQAALDNIREANPDVGSQARLIPIALSEALRVARSEQEEGGEIAFRVWPNTQTLDMATTMLNESGEAEPVESFPGIPVFYGESQDGVLTIEANGSEVVPFFFDRNDLAATLERAGEGDNAGVVDRTQIRVTSLNQVVNSMISPGSEANASKIEFVPARTSLEYVQQEFPDTLQE
ncbi:MAG: Tic22 family protein [Cyanobacteria bacterium P01_E01_bin.45]